MMKKIQFILLFSLFSSQAFAQDYISKLITAGSYDRYELVDHCIEVPAGTSPFNQEDQVGNASSYEYDRFVVVSVINLYKDSRLLLSEGIGATWALRTQDTLEKCEARVEYYRSHPSNLSKNALSRITKVFEEQNITYKKVEGACYKHGLKTVRIKIKYTYRIPGTREKPLEFQLVQVPSRCVGDVIYE